MATQRPRPRSGESLGNLALREISYPVVKRSVILRERSTSISLETPFWETVRVAASENGLALSALLNHIDKMRGDNNLSSAIRVFAFFYVQGSIPREALRSIKI